LHDDVYLHEMRQEGQSELQTHFRRQADILASSYYCRTCGIFLRRNDKASIKSCDSVAKNEDGGVKSMVAALEQERIQTLHKTYAKSREHIRK